MKAKGTLVMLGLVAALLGLTTAGNASPVGVYVNDDFTTTTVDTTEWTYDSAKVAGGQIDGSTVVITGETVMRSIDQVSPDAGQTVTAKGMGLGQSSTWSYMYFGMDGGDDAIALYQYTADGNGWTQLIVKKDGVEQTKWLGNKWYNLSGNHEFTWTQDRITWSLNGEVRFDTATDGGTWDIPTDPMGLVSTAGFNSNQLSFGAQSLEVTPEPATMLLLGVGVVGLVRRKR